MLVQIVKLDRSALKKLITWDTDIFFTTWVGFFFSFSENENVTEAFMKFLLVHLKPEHFGGLKKNSEFHYSKCKFVGNQFITLNNLCYQSNKYQCKQNFRSDPKGFFFNNT